MIRSDARPAHARLTRAGAVAAVAALWLVASLPRTFNTIDSATDVAAWTGLP